LATWAEYDIAWETTMATILICDSLAESRSTIRELLAANSSWTILESSSPDQTLEILGASDVNVVLTALHAPDAKERSLVEALRAQYPQIPAVVVTPSAPTRALVQALFLGAASYVPRSSLARELRGTVERLLVLADPRPDWDRIRPHWDGAESRYVLPNEQGLIGSVVHQLQDGLARFGICGPDQRMRVGIAISEALMNAIVHGNLELPSSLRETDAERYERELSERPQQAPYRDRTVRLNAVYSKSGATFTIADDGAGFDIRSVPDPTDEENLLKVTGRGLLLMRAFCDTLTHNESGNEVKLCVSSEKKH
jgi:CheY-like chemotaxis protein